MPSKRTVLPEYPRPPTRDLNAILAEHGTDAEKERIRVFKARGIDKRGLWNALDHIASVHGFGKCHVHGKVHG